jgi:cell division protein FtsI (penicillin-binding protein 3)
VISFVSKPDFDPHHPSKAKEEELFNKVSLGAYETGSVFKALTIAIAIDSDTVTMHDAYNISSLQVANFRVKDYHKEEGWRSVPEIFLHSSNIGTAQIMLELGSDKIKSYLKKLGVFDQLVLDIPERATPLYPKSNSWSDLSLTTISYGYSISMSPMHFVGAMVPTINGGIFRELSIAKKSESQDNGVRVFKESTSEQMKKMLRLSVAQGTGKKADVPGYFVGGKTGTAELQVGKKYVKNQRRSSFFGIIPSVDPKYVVYVMLDRPQPTKETFGFATAGWVAAPTVGKIMSRMAALYSIKPHDLDEEAIKEKLHVDMMIDPSV